MANISGSTHLVYPCDDKETARVKDIYYLGKSIPIMVALNFELSVELYELLRAPWQITGMSSMP